MTVLTGGLTFPEGFLWGTATASYQIEGAVTADGRGLSIWDTFSHTPGKTFHGDTGDIACDHYHRFEEDVALMAGLGLGAYRLSIAWPRVQPNGSGPVNQPGLDFYRRLVDRLLEKGIRPVVTLYHWDLPQALQDDGGWVNRSTADRFGEFASVVAGALGDTVDLWVTLNEPWVSAFVGYELGQHAPGTSSTGMAVKAAHNLLRAHGTAVRAVRAALATGAQVGITLNLAPVHPATPSEEDSRAAERVSSYLNGWFLDPVLRGSYPEWLRARYTEIVTEDFVHSGDMAEIQADIDFLGVNYYTTRTVANGSSDGRDDQHSETAAMPMGRRPLPAYLDAVHTTLAGVARTTKGWAIQPDGLRELLMWLTGQYGPLPLYVTENGAAFADYVDPNGEVHDPERIDYLRSHFAAAHQAIVAGADLRGYFVWSLLDNFEWADGYSQRFGLFFVDFKSQERTAKKSARFMAEVCRTNAVGPSAP